MVWLLLARPWESGREQGGKQRVSRGSEREQTKVQTTEPNKRGSVYVNVWMRTRPGTTNLVLTKPRITEFYVHLTGRTGVREGSGLEFVMPVVGHLAGLAVRAKYRVVVVFFLRGIGGELDLARLCHGLCVPPGDFSCITNEGRR